ncbi:MAG: hypothetical protein NC042_09370 [Ruminococcus flavefaciens]|nr:hypothetical protein [Ruminococcus flavefaciens]
MAEEKKKPEEEEQKESESPEAEKPEEKKEESPKSGDAEGKASDDKQAGENGEGAESNSEEKPEPEEKSPSDVPELSENDKLKAENLTLKTQLEALKIGFKPDCIEDAVVLAENLVKRDGSDITAALQSIAKKYPDWKSDAKSDKSAGGFKVGADAPKSKQNAVDESLDKAFGLRKKK